MRSSTRAVVFGLCLVWLSLAMDGAHGQASCGGQGGCDDGNPCTFDECDPVFGCIHGPEVGIPCEPENRCLEGGVCSDGACRGGSPRACDDALSCTVDGCDPETGCTHASPTCDDGDACTVDTCIADPSVCTHTPIECNDGNACTDDSCEPAAGCVYRANGSCSGNPKSLGFWQRVCRGVDRSGEFFTDIDVSCLQSISCMVRSNGRFSLADICGYLDAQIQDPTLGTCSRAAQEVIALSLNICRGRVAMSQGIDSQCTDFTVVRDAFHDADLTLCSDRFSVDEYCKTAWCESREINLGRALHLNGLTVSRLGSGAVRLVWIPPVADTEALTAAPRSYRVWRASGSDAPFVQIAEVTQAAFDDVTAVGQDLRYDVTPVW